MARKETSNKGGGHRVTTSNKYDSDSSRTATDVDVSKNGKIDNITDHHKDGSSHSHEVRTSFWDWSRGDKKDNKK